SVTLECAQYLDVDSVQSGRTLGNHGSIQADWRPRRRDRAGRRDVKSTSHEGTLRRKGATEIACLLPIPNLARACSSISGCEHRRSRALASRTRRGSTTTGSSSTLSEADTKSARASCPLSIKDNEQHPFVATLKAMRAEALRRAREMPIAND